ncbi:phospholipase, patatin family protein [Babesia caballi]|uniref:Phospholipase, patatin family protein n=1 Tax=Babesia caballi TaxID=5871 RepID=A0AAV4LL88_BABCB|nr:phospholipase, patatin family protein [Babesia caballi]
MSPEESAVSMKFQRWFVKCTGADIFGVNRDRMSLDEGAVSMKFQRGFVKYTGANLFGANRDEWRLVDAVNRDVERTLSGIFSRISSAERRKAPQYFRASQLDEALWSLKGPRLFVKQFDRATDRAAVARHFDAKRVLEHMAAQGQPVETFDASTLALDHKLRQYVDLVLHVRSRARAPVTRAATPSTSVDDSTAESPRASQDGESSPVRLIAQAYNCPFEIRLETPDRKHDHVSSNAPSYLLLFQNLVSAINKALVSASTGEAPDVAAVEQRCLLLDLFLGRRGAAAIYAREVVEDYCAWGVVSMKTGSKVASDITLAGLLAEVDNVEVERLRSFDKAAADVGFSFAPCGFMIPYLLGVMTLLGELNVIHLATPMTGGSAGALSVVSATSVMPDMVELICVAEGICRDVWVKGAMHRLDGLVKDNFDRLLQPGTYRAVNERVGELRVAVATRGRIRYRGHYVSQFHDNVDLRDGVRASCNIPGFSSTSGVYFRGEKSYDGYFASRTRELFCGDTAAARTVRVNPFLLGRRAVRRQLLANDHLNPCLQDRDLYLVHYLRLKCLLRALWERKIDYEAAGGGDSWRHEVGLMIAAYNSLTSRERQPGPSSWSRLLGQWFGHNSTVEVEGAAGEAESVSARSARGEEWLFKLFALVVASEMALDVGPASKLSTRNWSYDLEDVDLMRRFGTRGVLSFLSKTRCVATPYCLIDWLQREALSAGPDGDARGLDAAVLSELATLRELQHAVMPPLSLSYYYTEFPYLLPNSLSNLHRLAVALNSAECADVRYVFDVGRCDAFRWLVCEYICFENWLHLRVRQLKGGGGAAAADSPGSPSLRRGRSQERKGAPLHERQHGVLEEFLGVVDAASLYELLADARALDCESSTPASSEKLLARQNRLIRRAILQNVVHPHYSHLLSHLHVWAQ